MYRLFYPLRYFQLRNNQKRLLDIVPTLVLAAIMTFPFAMFSSAVFFSPDGFLDKLLTLSSALTGFYVAALTAAATLSNPDLDKVIRSGSIALVTHDVNGREISEFLTRRAFACSIFGYLAYAAMVFSILAAIAIGLSKVSSTELENFTGVIFIANYVNVDIIGYWLRVSTMFALLALMSHVFVVTSLGLYYLIERLHQHDGQITTPKPKSDEAA